MLAAWHLQQQALNAALFPAGQEALGSLFCVLEVSELLYALNVLTYLLYVRNEFSLHR